MVETARRCRPLGTGYHVKLSAMPAQTRGGVWLPDALGDQFYEGEVVAAGPGMRLPPPKLKMGRFLDVRSTMWAEVGDRVVFPKWTLAMIDSRERLGVVHDEDLYGIVDAAAGVWPANSWLLLEFEAKREEHASGLLIPQKRQMRPHKGTILCAGPGELRMAGPLAGTRRPTAEILGLPRDTDLAGMTVGFSRTARVYDISTVGDWVSRWLLHAADALVAYEG